MLLKPSICVLILSCLLCPVLAGHGEEEHEVDTTSGEFWGQIVAIFFLVIISGIIAGLTLGLMSLDTTNLQILEIAGSPQQQYYASKIIPIRKNGHILLTTLLLTNTVLNETLPILFDGIFSKGFISVIVSTALLVMFSEIIPQAIFSKHGLAIGALFAYPVRILIAMWFVLSWPISKFLDFILGTHTGFTYGVSEFRALVGLHDISKHERGTLEHKTVNVLQNVLDMQNMTAADIATSSNNMLMLKPDAMLNPTKVEQYQSNGYSHIFVFEQTTLDQDDYQILGVLELKPLNSFGEDDFIEPVGKMKLQSYLTASSRESAIDLMAQLLNKSIDQQVILIYRTEEDIRLVKEEQAALTREVALIQANTLRKHKSGFKCRVRRLFGLECQICTSLLSNKPEADDEASISTNPTTIDVELESGLLGMTTVSDILHQLVSATQIEDQHMKNSKKINISRQSVIVGLNVVSN